MNDTKVLQILKRFQNLNYVFPDQIFLKTFKIMNFDMLI